MYRVIHLLPSILNEFWSRILGFSQLYLLTKYCDVDEKKGTQYRWKCYKKNLYLQEKRGRKRIILANSRFAGNLSERSVILTGLYFLFLFGWVEEIEPWFLCCRYWIKSSHVSWCLDDWENRRARVDSEDSHEQKREFVKTALVGVWWKSKKVACDWLFSIQSQGP